MAELSAETKAIIDRLKAEGDLLRNSGTNSIRSVKIEMAKFESVFNTISANIVEQTKILQMQAGLAQEAVEVQRSREQLDELQQEQNKTSNVTDQKIEKIGDQIEESINKAMTFRGALGTLKNIAMIGGGLFVGYNLLKGFIDEQTGGGFSSLEDSIADTDWSALSSSVNGFVSGVSAIDWASLSTAVNLASSAITNFGDWMENLLPGILVGGILGSVARGALRGSIEGLISGGGGRRDPSDARLINGAQRTAIRAGIAGIVAAGVLVFGNQVKDWVNRQSWSDNEIGGARVGDVVGGAVDVASAAATGASIGAFFGPGGALAGAILGGSVALGIQLFNWFQRRKDEREAQLARDLAEADRILETRREEFDDLASRMATMSEADQAAATAGMSGGEIQALNQVISPMQETINALTQAQYDAANMRLMSSFEDPIALRDVQDYTDTLRSLAEEGGADAVQSLIAARNLIDQRLSSSISESGERLPGVSVQRYESDQATLRILNELITAQGYRTGTQGFMDFGAGQYAILHGREAVVPFNSAAGRFLDQYFTENWQPKVTNNQRLQAAAQGGGGGTVVINAPTTVSPNINNVSGGRSLNQVSVRGTGGGSGGPSINPYGLPGFAN